MDVFIARDGVEIGECSEADLAQLAREGQLLPTDYYWRDGMETWLPLGELLPSETWVASPPAKVPEEPAIPPQEPLATTQRIIIEEEPRATPARFQLTRHARLIAAIACATLVIGGIAFRVVSAKRSQRTAASSSFFLPAKAKSGPSNEQIRDKAAADLRAKINALPAKPAPPLYIFYYGVSVDMRPSLSPRTAWMATIRGGENTVDPGGDRTLAHTDFVLTVEFRDDAWFFKHYSASVSDIVKEQTTDIDDDPSAPTPPSIVGMLGLKMPPP